MYDSCEIFVIVHYARITAKRRHKRGLPPLRDPNDLPDPVDAEVTSTALPFARAELTPRPRSTGSVLVERRYVSSCLLLDCLLSLTLSTDDWPSTCADPLRQVSKEKGQEGEAQARLGQRPRRLATQGWSR